MEKCLQKEWVNQEGFGRGTTQTKMQAPEQEQEPKPTHPHHQAERSKARTHPEASRVPSESDTITALPEELWAFALGFLWESCSWRSPRSVGLHISDDELLSHNVALLRRRQAAQGERANKPKTTTRMNRKDVTIGECFKKKKNRGSDLKPLLQARAVCKLFKRLVDALAGMDALQPFAERVLARSVPRLFVSPPPGEDGGPGGHAEEPSRWGWPWSQQSGEGRVEPQKELKVLSNAVIPAIKARLQARVLEECLSEWWKPRFSSSSHLQQTIKRAQQLLQSGALRLIYLEREENRFDVSYALGIRAVLLISFDKLHQPQQGEEERQEEDLVIGLDVVQGWDSRRAAWDMGFFMRARLPPSSSTLQQQDEAKGGWRKALGIQQELKQERREKEDTEEEQKPNEINKEAATTELTAPLAILNVAGGSGKPTLLNKALLRRLWQLLFQTNNSGEEEEDRTEVERSMFEILSVCSSFCWKQDLDHVWLTTDEEQLYWRKPVQWMLNNKRKEEKGEHEAQKTSQASQQGKPASTLEEGHNLGFIDLSDRHKTQSADIIAVVMKDDSLKAARATIATFDNPRDSLHQSRAEARYLWMFRQAQFLQANIVAWSILQECPLPSFIRLCSVYNLSVNSGTNSEVTVTRSKCTFRSRPSFSSPDLHRVKLEAKEKAGKRNGYTNRSLRLTLTSTLNTFAMLLSASLRCTIQPEDTETKGGEEEITVVVHYDKNVPLDDKTEDEGEEKHGAKTDKNGSTCIPLRSLFQLPASSSSSSPQPTTNEIYLRHLLLGLGLRIMGNAATEYAEEVVELDVKKSLWSWVQILELEPCTAPFSIETLRQHCGLFATRKKTVAEVLASLRQLVRTKQAKAQQEDGQTN
ncbi:hypothetical protein QOT17_008067 [Balamuthia mandrillaris]